MNLYLAHLCLNILNLGVLRGVAGVVFLDLCDKFLAGNVLVSITHSLQHEMVLNFLANLLVLLLDHVDVGVQHVNVVVKRVVLLFGLNKSRYDFLDRTDTSGLFNLAEGVHDDLDVTGVHVHKCTLFLVVGLPALETGLQ